LQHQKKEGDPKIIVLRKPAAYYQKNKIGRGVRILNINEKNRQGKKDIKKKQLPL
jgi:hypothetical protein